MVSFTPGPLHYRGMRPWYPMKTNIGKLQIHQLTELRLSANRLLTGDISIVRLKFGQLYVPHILQKNC